VSRIDHVAVVVDDLDEARRFVGGMLGLELVSEGESSETAARYAFYQWGEVQLEILEITDPEKRRRRMGGERSARIEHIGVAVDDLAGTVADLRAKGVRTMTAEPIAVGNWRYYFTDPETTDGVVYQFFSRTG
jgi:catechol 2,3-dioxygenase-like lactoylglutathione lyase family enzyme